MHSTNPPRPRARYARWPLVPLAAAVAVAVAVSASPGYADAPDTQPPTRPGPIIASNLTTSSVTLTWAPSTDNIGVVSYLVTIGLGDVVSRKQSRTNSITLTDLATSNTYFFQVAAGDAVGNLSAPSDLLSVTLPSRDDQPPSTPGVPTAAHITATKAEGGEIELIGPPSSVERKHAQ